MNSRDKQLLHDALRRQNRAVTTSATAARVLLRELGLLTKAGKLKKSVTPAQ